MSGLVADTSGQLPRPEKRRFGRYVLHYRVAQGGMAAVYLARIHSPEGFEKWVAVKAILPHLAAEKSFVDMFLSEARLVARIDHPNVCSVFDFGEAEGTYYLAMEYLHGEPLSALQRRVWPAPGFPLELAGRIVADAAHGLHASHELCTPDGRSAEVVHRDVSPQNIFVLYSGVTKVVDFGIARSNDRLTERTEVGMLKGKLAYMSPEHIREQRVDRRTDVFALGVVLWEITVGQRLFRRDVEVDTLMAVLRDEIPRPSSLREGYPEALEAIVMRALERDPAARYQTAGELARDLEAFLVDTGRPSGQAAVGEFMQATFARQISVRNAMLQRRMDDPPAPEIIATSSSTRVPTAVASLSRRGAGSVLGPLLAGAAATALMVALVALSRAPSAPSPGARPAVTPASAERGTAPMHSPATPERAATKAPPRDGTEPAPTAEAGSGTSPSASTSASASVSADAGAGASASVDAGAVIAGPRDADADPEHGPPGFLNLVAIPTATVFEGGRLLGTTPLVHRSLPPGPHTLRLVPVMGGAERRVQVHIRSGHTHAASLRWP